MESCTWGCRPCEPPSVEEGLSQGGATGRTCWTKGCRHDSHKLRTRGKGEAVLIPSRPQNTIPVVKSPVVLEGNDRQGLESKIQSPHNHKLLSSLEGNRKPG